MTYNFIDLGFEETAGYWSSGPRETGKRFHHIAFPVVSASLDANNV
jgi:hypothetical protein